MGIPGGVFLPFLGLFNAGACPRVCCLRGTGEGCARVMCGVCSTGDGCARAMRCAVLRRGVHVCVWMKL
eukprot:2273054-Rhodomonas_salina.1